MLSEPSVTVAPAAGRTITSDGLRHRRQRDIPVTTRVETDHRACGSGAHSGRDAAADRLRTCGRGVGAVWGRAVAVEGTGEAAAARARTGGRRRAERRGARHVPRSIDGGDAQRVARPTRERAEGVVRRRSRSRPVSRSRTAGSRSPPRCRSTQSTKASSRSGRSRSSPAPSAPTAASCPGTRSC